MNIISRGAFPPPLGAGGGGGRGPHPTGDGAAERGPASTRGSANALAVAAEMIAPREVGIENGPDQRDGRSVTTRVDAGLAFQAAGRLRPP